MPTVERIEALGNYIKIEREYGPFDIIEVQPGDRIALFTDKLLSQGQVSAIKTQVGDWLNMTPDRVFVFDSGFRLSKISKKEEEEPCPNPMTVKAGTTG